MPISPLRLSRSLSPRPPANPTALVEDSNVFLTTLAAQERRVLELREELKKTEEELLRLKKQWATHEAIKKRNESRHGEQLQRIKVSNRTPAEGNRDQDEQQHCPDRTECPARRLPKADLLPHQDLESHIGSKQAYRKVFSGSRQIRTLSLLSQAGTPTASPDQLPQRPASQQISPPRSAHGSNEHTLPSHEVSSSLKRYKPNEDLIETSKQLVGDLREGLKTFFEDIRQATVGEEASSSPDRINNTVSGEHCSARAQRSRQSQEHHVPKAPPRRSDGSRADRTSDRPTTVPPGLLDVTKVQEQPSTGIILKRDRVQEVASYRTIHDDEEQWDSWDMPVAHDIAPRHHAETVIPESLLSPSTELNIPRSSMR
ncbi:MAG: hypothetical protein Q9220_003943 [cf. Caloplaca sp. 1 TL-2023]